MDTASRRRRAYAGWLVVLLVALAGALALRPAGAQDDGLADPDAFAASSYANNCTECHGSEGRGARVPGTDLRGPALAGRDDVTAAYVDLVLRTGRMPPAGDPFDNRAREVFYTDAERQAMVDWMVETFDLARDIPEVGEGDVAEGLEVYSLNCAHCHGSTGAGGTAGAGAWTPQVNHLDPVTVVEAIRVGPFEMPAFGRDVITDEEADSVATFLQEVGREEGTPVLGLMELNPVFASGFVGVLALALLASLLYIGGRPVPLETGRPDEPEARPAPAPPDSDDLGTTPTDPAPTRPGGNDPTAQGQNPPDEGRRE